VVLPHAPSSVHLFFNERVDPVGRGVWVVAPGGRRVEKGPAQVSGAEVSMGVGAAEPGTYLVVWRVVATDTHPAQGAYRFSVVRPSAPSGGMAAPAGGGAGSALGLVLQVLARALHLAGFALSVGVFAFRQMALVPRALTADPQTERGVWRLIGGGILALLIAEPLALVAQAVSLSAGGPFDLEVVGGILDSSFGRVLAQRVGGAVFLWVLVGAVRNAHVREVRTAWAVLGLGAAMALVDGEAAHAMGTQPAWLGLGLNLLHEGAMALWVGALVGLLGVWRLPGVAARRRELVIYVARIAAVSLAVLTFTGTAMALQHLTGLRDLLAIAYGRTLAAKLGALGALLLLAVVAARAPADRRPRWWAREVALLFGVLTLAALLVSVAPPR
jgi:putative copper export protein